MKTKIIYFLLIFYVQVVFSQIKSGAVAYQFQATEPKDAMLISWYESFAKNHATIVKEFNFELKFNNEKSIFLLKEKLYSDANAAKMSMLLSGYKGKILVKNDTLYRESAANGIGEFIVYKSSKQNWVITTETKIINNYICYKATTEDVIITVKTFRHPIVAWYCPAIAFPYGPLGYGGLPGLIIELQTKDGVYGASKIELSEKTIEIENLKKIQLISDLEFIEKINTKRGVKF